MVSPTAQPVNHPVDRLALYTVTSSADANNVDVCIFIATSFAILILDSFVEHAVSEQYDCQHRDCRELHPPEAQVCWLAYCDYCAGSPTTQLMIF